MTPNEARRAIYDKFHSDWTTGNPLVPLSMDSEEFTPPASGPFLRLSVRHTDARQETLGEVGRRNYERIGRVYVQIFNPKSGKQKDLDTYAASALAILEGTRLGTGLDVVVGAGVTREIGPTERWIQCNVEFPFTYHDIR